MIQPIRKKLLFILLISAAFTSCDNKNKKDAPSDAKKEKVADADHTFDITLVKGSETVEYSNAVPNKEGNALYNNQQMPTGNKGDRRRSIMMSIGKDANRDGAGVFGIFIVNEDFKPVTDIKSSEKYASNLIIRTKNEDDRYSAISGTLTFSDLKFVLPMPNNGAAAFTLDFEGEFQKNNSKEDIYNGTGTIVLSPKRDMGVYKAK